MTYRVLIVDDSKLARMAVIRMLAKLKPDYTYVEAANPDEAVAILKTHPAQLAVVDFNMPVRDGLTLAAELRVIDPEMPIALVSANTQQEILQQAKALGVRFLEKPLTTAAMEGFLAEASAKLGA
jgi:CheY-like chemotaxis protein